MPHNTTLTASVYLSAYEGQTAYFWLDELGVDGATVRVHKATTPGVLQRLSHTITTTPETVAVTFGVARAVTVTAPALTLTDHVRPWGVGRGCTSAVVDVTARDPLWTATSHHIYGAADATSFTIRELIA